MSEQSMLMSEVQLGNHSTNAKEKGKRIKRFYIPETTDLPSTSSTASGQTASLSLQDGGTTAALQSEQSMLMSEVQLGNYFTNAKEKRKRKTTLQRKKKEWKDSTSLRTFQQHKVNKLWQLLYQWESSDILTVTTTCKCLQVQMVLGSHNVHIWPQLQCFP